MTKMLTFRGARDTNINTGVDYNAVTFGEIAAMAKNPPSCPKDEAQAYIPSSYIGHDGRTHSVQTENGLFHSINMDSDTGDVTLEQLDAAIVATVGDVSRIIYSSRGATQAKQKWRAIIPVQSPISGSEYYAVQDAVFDQMATHGIRLDRSLNRTGQPIYLPNRGEFYDYRVAKGSGGLKSINHVDGLQDRILARAKREAAEAEVALAEAKAKAAERQRKFEATGELSPIDHFNAHNDIEALLAQYDWTPMGKGKGCTLWASPFSQSGGPSVRCYTTDQRCVSFTGSDVGQVGRVSKTGNATYDAFDVFVARAHGGNHDAAIRAVLETMGRDKVQFADVPEYQPKSASLDDFDANSSGDGQTQQEANDEGPAQYPTPYDMFDEAALPPRRFIYGRYYIRGFCSFLASPGGTGKTALQIVEALSIATGRDLLGEKVYEQTNVWMANLEDPIEEMQRRVLAAMKYHRVKPEEVRNRFFMDAGRSLDITFAMQSRDGVIINEAMVDYMRKRIIDLNIGVVMLDPFVGCHDVQENDNGAQNKVMSVIRRLADETNASIVLVHHTRKMNGAAVDVDSIRGAGSLIGAARSARVVNPVSDKRAGELGIDPEQTRGLFEVADGKNNLTPKSTDAILRRFESVTLDNGDFVGVVAQAKAPGAFHDVTDADVRTILRAIEKGHERDDGSVIGYSTDTRAKERWAGNVIISHEFERLGYIGEDHAKAILRGWTKAGRFTISTIKDHQNRREIQAITEVDMQVGVVS